LAVKSKIALRNGERSNEQEHRAIAVNKTGEGELNHTVVLSVRTYRVDTRWGA